MLVDGLAPWIAALGFALAALSLPGTIELLLLTVAAMFPMPKRPEPTRPVRLAIVVPAYNERENITACVRSLQRAAGVVSADGAPPPEIVVVADNCSDETATIARDLGARVLERFNATDRGKGFALDYAFTELADEGFDAFVVVDADSEVAANFLSACALRFAGGADALQCRYLVLNAGESLRTRLMTVALYAFNVLRPRGRERLGLSVGIYGNGFGMSAATLREVPYDARSVVEDLEYHLRLVAAGKRVQFVDNTCVRALMPTSTRGATTQRSRWEGGRLRLLLDRAPSLAAATLSGRLRLFEPLLDLLLMPLAFHVMLLLPLLLLPHPWTLGYGLFALALVACHVLVAIRVGGGTVNDVAALAAAPFYIVWKLTLVKALKRNAKRDAAWVRTERETQPGGP